MFQPFFPKKCFKQFLHSIYRGDVPTLEKKWRLAGWGIRRVGIFLGESTHCSPLQANQQLHMRLEKKENNKQGLDGFVDLRYMEGHRKQLKNRRCVDPRRKATSPSASSRRRAPIHPPPPSPPPPPLKKVGGRIRRRDLHGDMEDDDE